MRRAAAFLTLAALAACSRPGPAPAPPPLQGPSPGGFIALDRDPAQCRAALERLGMRATVLPPRTGPMGCGYPWAVQRAAVPAGHPRWLGEPPVTSCAVAAALTHWERDVLQPAALRHFGERVSAIRHFGSYGCRPINNRPGARLSEHARANAIDIAGFQFASGKSVTVKDGWFGASRDQAFLREVRQGACRSFGTVLSPDYDAPHADHLHFDQMQRSRPFCG